MIKFSSDPKKAASNLRKHGVSFAEASTVFGDILSSTLRDEGHSEDEERWIVVGRSSAQRNLFVVYTEENSSVRLIGARVATPTERAQYEEAG